MFNRPHAINQVIRDDRGRALARLGGLEGLARSMAVTVLPLAALSALESKAAVTNAFFAGSFIALAATLNVGRLESWMARRWVVTLAFAAFVGANLIAVVSNGPTLALAIGLISAEAAIFAVCISLFIMDYIGKRELARNESRRMVHSGVAWMVGPLVSIFIYTEVSETLPFWLSGGVSLLALGYFWVIRLGDNPALSTPKSRAPSPLENIPRYFRQRYLRIAYLITLVRGTFWVSLFIYAPLYALEAGLPQWTAGGIVAVVAALLLLSPLVLRVVDRTSTRAVIVVGFLLIAVSTAALGAVGEAETYGMVFWITGALGATWLDVLGNIPFMRTVKPRERTAMMTVFSSCREMSSMAGPGAAALTLLIAPFWVFYFVLSAAALVTAWASSYLPRRL